MNFLLPQRMEEEVSKINQYKTTQNHRIKKVQQIVSLQEEGKKHLEKEEASLAKRAHVKDQIAMYVVFGIAASFFIIPFYQEDPSNFWFMVITVVCADGMMAMKKKK